MRKKYSFYIAVLSVMLSMTLIGSVLLSQAAAKEIEATVTFVPNKYTWGDPPPDPWTVYIRVGWWYTWRINGSTVLLEGTVAPKSWRNWFFIFIAYFDGYDVLKVIAAKLVHEYDGVVPGIYDVPLTITGKYRYRWYTYNRYRWYTYRDFEGTGYIKVTVPA